jgi:hypothetical protein
VGNGASSAATDSVAHNAGAISLGLSGSAASPAVGSTDSANGTGNGWPVFSASRASPAEPSKHKFAMQAVYFRPEKFKSKADCLTAAYRQLLPLEVCR